MANKPKKNWDDVKMVISALSVTATLALWNIFAAATTENENTQVAELTPEPTAIVEPTATPTQPPYTGIILLGGEAPKPRVIVRSGGGGGGGAVTTTASS